MNLKHFIDLPVYKNGSSGGSGSGGVLSAPVLFQTNGDNSVYSQADPTEIITELGTMFATGSMSVAPEFFLMSMGGSSVKFARYSQIELVMAGVTAIDSIKVQFDLTSTHYASVIISTGGYSYEIGERS